MIQIKRAYHVFGGVMVALALGGTAYAAAPAPRAAALGDLPQSDPRAVAEFRKQADALYRLKEKAFVDKDPEAIVNLFYTRDAVSVGPDTSIMGREALRAEYEKVTGMSTVRIAPVRSYVGKDAAWDWTNFDVTPTDGQAPFTFAMVFLWAKVDGRWVCAGDAYAVGKVPASAAGGR